MRILILTQKVDAADDVLGFFYHWLLEFSRYAESLTVICLEEGTHNLPDNVRVFSLGKESLKIKNWKLKILWRIAYVIQFYRLLWNTRRDYDAVFVHMNPEYVVLGGLLWRLWNKKIGLWYVHRQINVKLRIAEKLAHVIFSTTPEAFRLKSKKVHFLGHGINFSHFARKKEEPFHKPLRILHVGRITSIKRLEILFEAIRILQIRYNIPTVVTCVGAPVYEADIEYLKKLKKQIENLGLSKYVSFVGSVSYQEIPNYYRESDVSVNLTPTGGMDKAVLESIASGTIALSANRAFKDLFGKYAEHLLYNERDAEDTADKIMNIINMNPSERKKIEDYLYERALKRFNLDMLIKRIIHELYCL